jgi:hypothetical protein
MASISRQDLRREFHRVHVCDGTSRSESVIIQPLKLEHVPGEFGSWPVPVIRRGCDKGEKISVSRFLVRIEE